MSSPFLKRMDQEMEIVIPSIEQLTLCYQYNGIAKRKIFFKIPLYIDVRLTFTLQI